MKILAVLLAIVVPYLVGGINPAIVLSNLIYHRDIRQCGSKNPGFTNFKRVFGGKIAWLVFVLDIAKSVAVCLLGGWLFGRAFGQHQLGVAFAGLFVMLGHCFPAWYGFHGGKAFLAGAGAIWCIDWRAGLVAMCVLMLVLFSLHYMSLASVCAGLSCPATLAIVGVQTPWVLALCVLSVALMVWRHKANLLRLKNGTESRFYFGHKSEAASGDETMAEAERSGKMEREHIA